MSVLLTALLVQATAATAVWQPPVSIPAGSSTVEVPAVKQTKYCRDMMNSSSRLGSFKVCKTRSEWARWDRCHSPTRYCEPVKAAFVKDDGDVICKYSKVTGTRLGQDKMCATRRQWYVMEQEAQEALRDRQNRSTLTAAGDDPNLLGSPAGPR
jgi:hypothetical protein